MNKENSDQNTDNEEEKSWFRFNLSVVLLILAPIFTSIGKANISSESGNAMLIAVIAGLMGIAFLLLSLTFFISSIVYDQKYDEHVYLPILLAYLIITFCVH